jgi:hypothetical protein
MNDTATQTAENSEAYLFLEERKHAGIRENVCQFSAGLVNTQMQKCRRRRDCGNTSPVPAAGNPSLAVCSLALAQYPVVSSPVLLFITVIFM